MFSYSNFTRRYNLESKLFQQLLNLKQMEIRITRAYKQVFPKWFIFNRLQKDAITVGLCFPATRSLLLQFIGINFRKQMFSFYGDNLQWFGNAGQLIDETYCALYGWCKVILSLVDIPIKKMTAW